MPEHKEPTYMHDKLYPSNEIHITAGPSGSGKTSLEGMYIEDWRKGKPIFGYRTFPAPFCYIACDRSLQSIHATLRRLDLPYKEWPIISLIDHHATNIPQILLLARKLVSDVRVLWIDGIHSICPEGKINDYSTVSNFLTNTTRLCQREDITIRAMGHATKVKKGEEFLNPRHRILGTVAWGGFSDTITLIDQADPENVTDSRRIVQLLPRNEEAQVLKYEIVEGKLVQQTDVSEMLLDRWVLTQTAGLEVTTEQIHAEGTKMNLSRATITRWIRQASDSGKLQKCGRGCYKVTFAQ